MGRRARILLHLHIQREKIVLRGSRAGRRSGCRNHPSCVWINRDKALRPRDSYANMCRQCSGVDSRGEVRGSEYCWVAKFGERFSNTSVMTRLVIRVGTSSAFYYDDKL